MNENKKDLFIQDFLKTQSQEGGGSVWITPPANFNFLILNHIQIEIKSKIVPEHPLPRIT